MPSARLVLLPPAAFRKLFDDGTQLAAAAAAQPPVAPVYALLQAAAPPHAKSRWNHSAHDWGWAPCRDHAPLAAIDFLVGNNDRRVNCFTVLPGSSGGAAAPQPLGLDTEGCFPSGRAGATREAAMFGAPRKGWKGLQLYQLMHMQAPRPHTPGARSKHTRSDLPRSRSRMDRGGRALRRAQAAPSLPPSPPRCWTQLRWVTL